MRFVAVLVCALLAATAAGAARAAEPLRVGVVLDSAGVSNPLEKSLVDGVRRAISRHRVRAEIVTPSPREGSTAALARFARQGFGLVLVFENIETGVAAVDVARRYPGTMFAVLDFSRHDFDHPPPNVIGVPFRDEQIGYVVGQLAALMERRRPGPDVVSAIGGVPIPAVKRFITGYDAGARKAAPGITVLVDYSGSFTARAKCRRIALAQFARGAGTVFDVAGDCGRGTLAAAKGDDRWAIGVDFDRSDLGPFVLSSAVKRWDTVAPSLIGAFAAGRLKRGRDFPQTLATGALTLGKFSPLVPQGVRRLVRAVLRAVAAGQVRMPASTSTPP